MPTPGAAESGVTYYYKGDELELRFDFRDTLQREHSLAAFRDTLLFSTVTWKTTAKSPSRVGEMQISTWSHAPEVEFVSYEALLLHVRVHAVEVYANPLGPDPSPPYPCLRQTPAGPLPDVCTEAFCSYAEPHADRERGVRTTLDVSLPVEPPHEGLSAL